MNIQPFKQIYKFNQETGLLDLGYSDIRECAYPIEEALEGFNLTNLADVLDVREKEQLPKYISRRLLWLADDTVDVPDVDRLDKHLDTIVFALGSIYKLGLNPQQTMKALGVVANANMQKLTAGKDEEGKQRKPEGFIPPETQLQKILDER